MKKAFKRTAAFIMSFLFLMLGLPFTVGAKAATDETAEEIVNKMSEEEKITQILMPAFRYWTESGGEQKGVTDLNNELSQVIKEYHFGGVILFAQNLVSTDQMVKLTDSLQKSNAEGGNIPLLISTDQEGGIVVRLGSGCRMTGNMALGAANDEKAAYDTGDIMGSELASVGINVDFAPVMDTNSNPKNPVIGLRSFSDDPQRVAKLGVQMIKGLHNNNVATALKHFPGHGDTDTDSHSSMPIIYKDLDELKKVELVPFQEGMDAGSDMIMTTHIQYPNVITETLPTKNKDANGKTIYIKPPATLSKTILTDLMRNQMDYKGVIVTDAMNMEGITDNFEPADAAIYSIKAGADIILMPCVTQSLDDIHNNLDPLITTIKNQAETDEDLKERIEESALRVVQLKINRNLMKIDETSLNDKIKRAEEAVGSDEHHDREREIADEAVTVVKNDKKLLPIKPKENQKILLIGAYSNEPPALQFGLQQLIKENRIPTMDIKTMYYYNNYGSLDTSIQSAIEEADYVIAVTETTNESRMSPNHWITRNPRNIVEWSKNAKKPCILVSIDLPYDVANYPEADTMLAVYGSSGMDPTEGGERPATNYGPNIPAAIDIIFGAHAASGTLPVNIPKIVNSSMSTTEIEYKRGFGLTGETASVDREYLEKSLLEAAQYKDPEKYTVESWTTFTAALDKAKETDENQSATQADIDSAKASLTSAIQGLVLKEIHPTGLTLSQTSLTLKVKHTGTLSATVAPENATNKTITWTSSNSSVATVINGVVTAKSVGTATITAVTVNDKTATCVVTVKKASTSDNDNDDDQDNKPSKPVTPSPTPEQTFASDTTRDFSVNGSYQFKITSTNGKPPVFVIGTPGVFEIESTIRNGNDYFIKLRAIGAPGDKAGIYINNGQRLLVATVGSNPNYVKLDTGKQLSVKAGKTYQFRVTAAKKPTFICGTGSTFHVTYAGSKGNDYFFKVTATGKAGAKAGFYVNGEKAPRTVGTIIS